MKKLYLSFLLASLGAAAQPGNLCTDPIIINSLPFSATDDTANYGDNYDPQTTTHPSCSNGGFGNYYHGGNDVIYSFTPPTDMTLKFELPNVVAWTGIFIYTDCANIGIEYAACAKSSSAGSRTIDNFAATAGQTYYIYISSWPSPQTFAYTLNVTDVTLGVNQVVKPKNLRLYPNPASGILNLDIDAEVESSTIITVNGQRFDARVSGKRQVNVENLQDGFYILEVVTEDGSKTYRNFVKN